MRMDVIRAKKKLGQHFLKDRNIACRIVDSMRLTGSSRVLEIGPGMGILTRYLMERPGIDLRVIEIDAGLVLYLRDHFPALGTGIIGEDFLAADIPALFNGNFNVIGNFPYNISSQIFFRILEYRDLIPEVVCMVQKEVAKRISAGPGNKTYGILSVLLQAFYHIEYLFTVGESVFVPPPRVKSAVIRLVRNERQHLGCDETLFFRVVKTAFNQRRKMLSNALKPLLAECGNPAAGVQNGNLPRDIHDGVCLQGRHPSISAAIAGKRAENLTVDDFITLTNEIRNLKSTIHEY